MKVTGHADASGTPEANQALSVKRAEAAKDYLVPKGADPEMLIDRRPGLEGSGQPGQPAGAREPPRRDRPLALHEKTAGSPPVMARRSAQGICSVAWPAKLTEITPPQMHFSFDGVVERRLIGEHAPSARAGRPGRAGRRDAGHGREDAERRRGRRGDGRVGKARAHAERHDVDHRLVVHDVRRRHERGQHLVGRKDHQASSARRRRCTAAWRPCRRDWASCPPFAQGSGSPTQTASAVKLSCRGLCEAPAARSARARAARRSGSRACDQRRFHLRVLDVFPHAVGAKQEDVAGLDLPRSAPRR